MNCRAGPGASCGGPTWRIISRSRCIKAAYRNASFIANNRVVFNIKGNDYRLVVAVHYNRRISTSRATTIVSS